MKTWLLINYTAINSDKVFPSGIAYISSTLKSNGYSVHCLDLAFVTQDQHESVLCNALQKTGAEVVGINGFSNEFSDIKLIVNMIRKYDPAIIIIAGGHMVSSDPERIHSWLSLDFAVVGEGEETIIELADALETQSDYSAIPGIVFKMDNKSVKTSEREVKNDINNIPFPDYNGFNFSQYLYYKNNFPRDFFSLSFDNPRNIPIVAARSCPYKCTFCSHSIKKYRMRSLDSIFEEIDLLVSTFGATGLTIYDDLFAVDAKRLDDFSRRISPKGLTWQCQVRADLADRDLLMRLRSAGCSTVSYGFESLNDDVLHSMKKHISSRDVKNAAKVTYESKLFVQANFLFGDSADTVESIDETLNWWAANRVYGINLSPIRVFPGTALYEDFVRRGLITDELKYIENGFPFPFLINGTKMTPQEHAAFVNGFAAWQSLSVPGYVLQLECDTNFHGIVDIICPHCDSVLKYGNGMLSLPKETTCKSCFAKFNIPLWRALGRRFYPTENEESINSAIQLMREGEYDKSMNLVIWAESEEITDIDAITTLATACYLLQKYEKAMVLFRKTLKIEPANAIAHNNYGVGLLAYGLVGWALLHFKQAVLLDNLEAAKLNADLASDWIHKNFDRIPFVQQIEKYPDKKTIAVPILSDGSPCIRRPPLRESLACHPLGGLHL